MSQKRSPPVQFHTYPKRSPRNVSPTIAKDVESALFAIARADDALRLHGWEHEGVDKGQLPLLLAWICRGNEVLSDINIGERVESFVSKCERIARWIIAQPYDRLPSAADWKPIEGVGRCPCLPVGMEVMALYVMAAWSGPEPKTARTQAHRNC